METFQQFPPPSLAASFRLSFPLDGIQSDYERLSLLAMDPAPPWHAISDLANKNIQLTHRALRDPANKEDPRLFGFLSRGYSLKGMGLANLGDSIGAVDSFLYAHKMAIESNDHSLFPEEILVQGLLCLTSLPHLIGYKDLLSSLKRDYSDPLLPAEDETRFTVAISYALSGDSDTAVTVLNAITSPNDPQASHEIVICAFEEYLNSISLDHPGRDTFIPIIISLRDKWGDQPLGVLED